MKQTVKKILLAENTARALNTHKCLLGREDFNVFTADTAEEALTLHREEKMDLIVADIDLPEMGGDTLCLTIKKDPELRRVYVSLVCSGKKADLKRCEKCGADSFLKSPPELVHVTEKICRILDIIERRDKRVLMRCTMEGTYMDEPFFSASRDLSLSGILFETDRTLARGDHVSMSFILPDATRVEAKGTVVRVLSGDSHTYRCGVEFTEMSDESRRGIAGFIEREGEQIKGEEIY